MTIADAKRALLLPELARRLNIAGEIPERDGQTVRCFWPERHKHGDRNRSFNFHDGLTRFKCFGCGAGSDGPDMIRDMLGISEAEARKLFLEWAGGGSSSMPAKRTAGRSAGAEVPACTFEPDAWGDTPEKAVKRHEWPALRKLRQAELEQVALNRGLSFAACDIASRMGWLVAAGYFKTPCWILRSTCGRNGQARRMGGQLWSNHGDGLKALTLSGSCARVPIGLNSLREDRSQPVCIVEGGPDLLACMQFAYAEDRLDVGVLAFLGAAMHMPDPLLERLRGRRVRIFAHADEAGRKAAASWAIGLVEWECEVDAFAFDAFGVKDFNDLAKLPADALDGMEVLP